MTLFLFKVLIVLIADYGLSRVACMSVLDCERVIASPADERDVHVSRRGISVSDNACKSVIIAVILKIFHRALVGIALVNVSRAFL